LLKSLPKSANTLRIIKRSLLPTLLNTFLSLPSNSLVYLELVNEYIRNIPDLVSRSSSQIIEYYRNAFLQEIALLETSSSQGCTFHRPPTTHKIFKILNTIQTILEGSSEIAFDDIEDNIAVPILSKLCEFRELPYEEELLSMLEVVLAKHSHFTFTICKIISKLPTLYEKNNKKLSIFKSIYLALALSPPIVHEVAYEYSDVILLMLQMFENYTSHVLTIDEFSFYRDEITSLIWNTQTFVQVYAVKIT
jgi:hypothetical protein